MRLIALILGFLFGSQTASAFDCAGVNLVSSIVICSDPELMRLADERQAAINEARGRIGEDAWPDLSEDQKAWVRSYATACGAPPDRPPPIPVTASITACFKRAALARNAFLRSYGVTAGGAPATTADDSDARITAVALEALGLQPTPAKVAAVLAWEHCTADAVDRFADQPESARTVAEAAMTACFAEEVRYMRALGIAYSESVREANLPGLLARVMERRAARALNKAGNR